MSAGLCSAAAHAPVRPRGDQSNMRTHCRWAPVLPRVVPNLPLPMPTDVKPLAIPEVKPLAPPILRDAGGPTDQVLHNPTALVALLVAGQVVAWTLAPVVTHHAPPLDVVEGYMWAR